MAGPPPAAAAASEEEGDNEDDDEEEEEEEEQQEQVVRHPVRTPPRRPRRNRVDPLVEALGGLSLRTCKPNHKMIWIVFKWIEGFLQNCGFGRENLLHRCTIEVVLPGPTSLNQLDCSVISKGMQVKVLVRSPGVFSNSSRTSAFISGNPSQEAGMITSRVIAHQEAITAMTNEAEGGVLSSELIIDLPMRCQLQFTTRDDYGRVGMGEAKVIVVHPQGDPDFNGITEGVFKGIPQYTFLLNLQLVGIETNHTTVSSPGRFMIDTSLRGVPPPPPPPPFHGNAPMPPFHGNTPQQQQQQALAQQQQYH